MLRMLVIVLLALGVPAVALADPPQTHEILINRPSGFWTSNRPAVGGAYRYRLLLLGCAIALGMGWMTWRIVQSAKKSGNSQVRQKAADQRGRTDLVE